MIHSLRRKFILVAMGSTLAVLAVILGGILFFSYQGITDQADRVLTMLGENQGRFPAGLQPPLRRGRWLDQGDFTAETPYETRYFSVLFHKEGTLAESNLQNIASVTEEEAEDYARRAAGSGKESGFEGKLRYRVTEDERGVRVSFVDCTRSLNTWRRTAAISLAVAAAGLLLVFLLVAFFSRLVFRPVEESDRKQKQFITDASHELKTPLAIIDANAEVLELTAGENEWTGSIRRQVKRLTALVGQMVTLTRMDESGLQGLVTDFSLTEAVTDTAEFFVLPAEIQGKELETQAEPGLMLHGDEDAVRQLISLLLDNAVKYSAEGVIRVSLSQKGKKRILTVTNPVDEIEKGDQDILFERFYRRDSSRSKETGGSGIGLSVARAIVQRHQGSIHAFSPDGRSLRIRAELRGVPVHDRRQEKGGKHVQGKSADGIPLL